MPHEGFMVFRKITDESLSYHGRGAGGLFVVE